MRALCSFQALAQAMEGPVFRAFADKVGGVSQPPRVPLIPTLLTCGLLVI